MRLRRAGAVAALAIVACGGEPEGGWPDRHASSPPEPDATGSEAVTRLEMRNVALIVAPGVVQHVLYLRGREVSRRPGQPVVLDDKHAYEVRIEVAETAMDWSSLTAVMNEHVFADFAPIGDVTVGPGESDDDPGTIEIEGMLRTIPPIEFEIEGILEPSADGNLRVRTTSIQAFEIGVEGLMDLFDVEAEEILPKMEERGIRVEENDLVLLLEMVMPPPRVRGRVARVRVEPDRVVIGFGSAEEARAGQRKTNANYLFHRHGTIRIGKMTMERTDLRVLDQDPSDPFEYSVDRMNEQHVAGYIKLQMDGGLVVHAPDLTDMER